MNLGNGLLCTTFDCDCVTDVHLLFVSYTLLQEIND